MHAYWVKKQQGCLDKDRLESSDRSQQDADTDWMDKGLVDSRAPKTRCQLPFSCIPASEVKVLLGWAVLGVVVVLKQLE